DELQRLLQGGTAALPKDSPDVALYAQLTSLSGPLMMTALQSALARPADNASAGESKFGVDPKLFGDRPSGLKVDAASLCMSAPQVLEIRVPAALVAGAEFVTTGMLHPQGGQAGTVQLQLLSSSPRETGLVPGTPILAQAGSESLARIELALSEFRDLFPAALCYTQIVPVDEVVTLSLFFREDQQLRRLMLNEEETARLDRLWNELFFVAQEPIQLVTAYDQLVEFATQDRPDLAGSLKALHDPIYDRATKFREQLQASEPAQLEALVAFANQAYRRPLTNPEAQQLRALYGSIRAQGLSHDEALRLTLARVLVSPAFLYRLETPGPGNKAAAVSDAELANRLSYFLWSSQPDAELRALATAGKLSDPTVLAAQTRRMLRDPKARRLATEFACQWLHIYDFDHLDEKSERHFPTFAGLRGAMYEESILFFTDLFQNDRSLLNIVDADYTYLNQELAAHYGIPNVQGAEWRRVEGVKQYARGGVLTQATALSKQSGASRTSPILRGNWLSEVVLGEKLPKPPKDVPQLADSIPEGLTERQLTERHVSDASCAKCHQRIDPFGYALESYDAIGRFREKDASGLMVSTKTVLPGGKAIEGLPGLRSYLLTDRKAAFVRQFDRKLLGYALGRSIQLSDEPLLTEMQAALDKHDYRVGAVVEMIVLSPQFRMIRGRDQATE
ncbi:MAG TPA: DUF1592 domain-containing protein, partial [Pirellulaceae bacterium]|nr:DUF1592 domain-containing protein [Pirellulaceae bacterium]